MESEPPYLYVRGNVVNRVDPSGLCPPSIPECRGPDGRPIDSYYRYRSINPDAYIVDVIYERREEIKAAAHRHNLRPDFLAAVLYLENNNATEQWMQSSILRDLPQQCVKYLWNMIIPFTDDTSGMYVEDKDFLMKHWDYFKPGRSQGIGAIKPEAAIYAQQLNIIYNPYTGRKRIFLIRQRWAYP